MIEEEWMLKMKGLIFEAMTGVMMKERERALKALEEMTEMMNGC